jgi:hypothetical protein
LIWRSKHPGIAALAAMQKSGNGPTRKGLAGRQVDD